MLARHGSTLGSTHGWVWHALARSSGSTLGSTLVCHVHISAPNLGSDGVFLGLKCGPASGSYCRFGRLAAFSEANVFFLQQILANTVLWWLFLVQNLPTLGRLARIPPFWWGRGTVHCASRAFINAAPKKPSQMETAKRTPHLKVSRAFSKSSPSFPFLFRV